MGKKLAIEHHLIRPNEVIELLEMMGGKNKDNADGCSFLYYTLCTPKINNPNNEKVICGFTNLKMQNDYFAIFTLEKFWKKYPYKVGDKVVYEDDNDIVVISEIMWDDTVGDIFYNVKRIDEDDCFLCPPELLKPYKETNMNKKLAIKGHPTRGKEVIEILKMMGGENFNNYDGKMEPLYFLIDIDNIIKYGSNFNDNFLAYFTLEEFLEKYPFKVGDKVTLDNKLCSIIWMCWECNKIYYVVQGTDPMFTKKVTANELKPYKETNMNENKFPSFEPMFKMNDELEYKIPDGYEITEVSKDTVFIKPIKPQYPKTYKKCCSIVGGIAPERHLQYDTTPSYKFEEDLRDSLESLRKLLICCKAYWKIAGEQMGLGKSWEPDWSTENEIKYVIEVYRNNVRKNSQGYSNTLLSFPTKEMRDAFYENFKDMIEQCKKLL